MMNKENIVIRLMKEEDISSVYRIEKESFSDLWSEGTYTNYKDDKNRVYFVAEADGMAVAYCVAMLVLDECEILRIAVDVAYRKKGIGLELIKEVLKAASTKGARFFYLEVRAGNMPAINLYKKAGFIESGRRAGYYSKPKEDAVLMSLVK